LAIRAGLLLDRYFVVLTYG